jgi:hypothetical protein
MTSVSFRPRRSLSPPRAASHTDRGVSIRTATRRANRDRRRPSCTPRPRG